MNTTPKTDAAVALEASNLSVKLGGKQVLDIAALQVRTNQALVIIGPNGSGKPRCFYPGAADKTGIRDDKIPGTIYWQ